MRRELETSDHQSHHDERAVSASDACRNHGLSFSSQPPFPDERDGVGLDEGIEGMLEAVDEGVDGDSTTDGLIGGRGGTWIGTVEGPSATLTVAAGVSWVLSAEGAMVGSAPLDSFTDAVDEGSVMGDMGGRGARGPERSVNDGRE